MKKQQKSMLVLAMIMAFITAGLFLPGLAGAGALDPADPPGATMKTLDEVEPRIPISSLPYEITKSGSYYLTGDFTVSNNGILVKVDDVTIDLMGYTISGDGVSAGIGTAVETKNIEIRNGTIKNFGVAGILLSGGQGHRLINLRVVLNVGRGIGYSISEPRATLIKKCVVAGNGIDGLTVGDGSTVTDNTVYDNGNTGIMSLGSGTIVTGNTVYNNTGIGIGASRCTVTGNTVYKNGETGIFADQSTITGNFVFENAYCGIQTTNEGSVVAGNTANKNGQSGISSNYGTVTGNTANKNGRYGIYSNHGTVTGNTVCYNQQFGIWALDGLVDGNTATNNGVEDGGSYYVNIYTQMGCTMGLNHAP